MDETVYWSPETDEYGAPIGEWTFSPIPLEGIVGNADEINPVVLSKMGGILQSIEHIGSNWVPYYLVVMTKKDGVVHHNGVMNNIRETLEGIKPEDLHGRFITALELGCTSVVKLHDGSILPVNTSEPNNIVQVNVRGMLSGRLYGYNTPLIMITIRTDSDLWVGENLSPHEGHSIAELNLPSLVSLISGIINQLQLAVVVFRSGVPKGDVFFNFIKGPLLG